MDLKKHIPNLFTLGNLFSGLMALMFVFQNNFEAVAFFVVLGIVLDFFDGFLARILGVSGELGKQLDSLADMVTSGVVPGFVMLKLIDTSLLSSAQDLNTHVGYLAYFGLLLTLAAGYRLAKFNIDTRQSESFIGLPTPAMSLFIVSLPLIGIYTEIEMLQSLLKNSVFLLIITLTLSFLMNAELNLMALKFKNFSWRGNEFRYVLILFSVLLVLTMKYVAIPMIVILYLLLSALIHWKKHKD